MTLRIPAPEMQQVLQRLFQQSGFPEAKARTLAAVHTDNTLHGVHSHGINRVPQFIEHVRAGVIAVDAEAQKAESCGTLERWDGHRGPGVLNAIRCTDRAIALAQQHGMGLVALRNTNHWMRGGYYGWRVAEAGCIGILFTNTQPNMPAWGGREARIGNNPLIVAIPRAGGHVVLDMALSQFSFGKVHEYQLRGEALPYPGGWDQQDQLTTDPDAILADERGLPIGYWKGSALSMVLDMLATLLSAGQSTARIGAEAYETGVSQVYLCIDPAQFGDRDLQQRLLDEIIAYAKSATPLREGQAVRYPGERALQTKRESLAKGMAVSEKIWSEVLGLVDA
jgi:3-dehydro-L-gulonate 2-dehydrogenase